MNCCNSIQTGIATLLLFVLALFSTPALSHAAPNINVNANRTTGVAPLAVFFDATGTTSSQTTRPFHELDYLWNFGDASGKNWHKTGKTRNQAKGPIASHIFETPGTYNVRLLVQDITGQGSQEEITITVIDPDVAYSSTNGETYYFSSSGNFTEVPSGVPNNRKITIANFEDVAPYIANNRRLLLRRGDTWNSSNDLDIDNVTNGTIGAFGSCQSPNTQGLCQNAPPADQCPYK